MELVNLYMHTYVIVIGHVSVRYISNYSVLTASCVSVWLYDILHCCCGLVLLRVVSTYLRGSLHYIKIKKTLTGSQV